MSKSKERFLKHIQHVALLQLGGGGGGLTVLAGGSVPAVGADAPIPTDFVDARPSVQTGGALTVVDV